ncbi:hypothetical protein [Zhihengliuella flava]|uniref:Uncharacterized protein n=1 Tax=Zhihengliuella flava TaxID=1285193 RepID=A0A931GM41_9MICC|nr:hypothetical protein [Zhihengliuella flava]MBG6085039.1 hypothetical protein [Zhihengliuella flava]
MPTLGVMADPGLPEIAVRRIHDDVEQSLSQSDDGQWSVEVEGGALPLNADGDIPLLERAESLMERRQWDYLIYVTDLPRTYNKQPVAYELDASTGAALLSLPSLGLWRVRRRLHTMLADLALTLDRELAPEDEREDSSHVRTPGVRRAHHDQQDGTVYVTLDSRFSGFRLWAGMLRNNRPGRLLGALWTCAATAAAAGAFGIFYSSIWNMSDSLPTRRLILITVVAILSLSTWLIARNGLWTQSSSIDRAETSALGIGATRRQAFLDNAATFATVVISVALMYLILFVLLFLGAVTIVDSEYLAEQLNHAAGLEDYLTLSWLATSLGTMAGALGSNFDSESAIREATYSRRAQQRRQMAEDEEEATESSA